MTGTRILVTGGAGFIGSHVVDRLVRDGAEVTVVDNLSGGRKELLSQSLDRIRFVEGDCGNDALLDRLLPGMDAVWHLAANPEVRTGATDPAGHYEANVGLTFRVLEGMRRHDVRRLVFTSTSTVYGNATVVPTPEDYGPLHPISVYGACKLAGEALISAYAGTFGFDALLFRFANVVGPRSTHGVVVDFVRKLKADPKRLEILGDGRQTKSYVSVEDTVEGMMQAVLKAPRGAQAYNIGSRDAISVVELADAVAKEMGVAPMHHFTGGTKDGAGWTGDVKRMGLDTSRLEALGWKPRHSSSEAVRIAARSLIGK
jgi:UDP-glucose 4-epimerase